MEEQAKSERQPLLAEMLLPDHLEGGHTVLCAQHSQEVVAERIGHVL